MWQALEKMDPIVPKPRFYIGACLLTFLTSSLLTSCAYQFARQEIRLLRSDAEMRNYTLAIPVFDNTTTRTSPAESLITDSFRSRWARISNVKIVDSANAEFVLLGKIKQWKLDGGANFFTGTAATQAYGGLAELQSSVATLVLSLEVDLELIRNIDGAQVVEWSRTLSSARTFEAYDRLDERSGSSSAPLVHESRERIAMKGLAEGIANSSVDSFKENF